MNIWHRVQIGAVSKTGQVWDTTGKRAQLKECHCHTTPLLLMQRYLTTDLDATPDLGNGDLQCTRPFVPAREELGACSTGWWLPVATGTSVAHSARFTM